MSGKWSTKKKQFQIGLFHCFGIKARINTVEPRLTKHKGKNSHRKIDVFAFQSHAPMNNNPIIWNEPKRIFFSQLLFNHYTFFSDDMHMVSNCYLTNQILWCSMKWKEKEIQKKISIQCLTLKLKFFRCLTSKWSKKKIILMEKKIWVRKIIK